MRAPTRLSTGSGDLLAIADCCPPRGTKGGNVSHTKASCVFPPEICFKPPGGYAMARHVRCAPLAFPPVANISFTPGGTSVECARYPAMHQLMLLAAFGLLFSAQSAQGMGMGFGQPLEERVGGDYGPEYYRDWQQRQKQASQRRPGRCRAAVGPTGATRCTRRR